MGDLPVCRLDYGQKPFTHTGMDFFGPLEVTMFRRRLKRYVMLFAYQSSALRTSQLFVNRLMHIEFT
jgi:hypothetical protein